MVDEPKINLAIAIEAVAFRRRAAEHRAQAAITASPSARAMLLDIAEKYIALAVNEERAAALSAAEAAYRPKAP